MIEWLTLCQHALYDEKGCLCVFGVFHHMTGSKTPVRIPQGAIAFGVSGAPNQQVNISVRTVGPDGKYLNEGRVDLRLTQYGRRESYIWIAHAEFDEFGTYQFELDAGGGPRTTSLTVTPPARAH